MKTFYKDIFHVLRRFKTATILNIIGLSTAFAAFIIIMMQVDYDYNFDQSYEDADQIYRIELDHTGKRMALSSRGMYDYIMTLPQVKDGAFKISSSYKFYFSTSEEASGNLFVEMASLSNDRFPHFFNFEMVEGTQDALTDPKAAIIPESMAKKIFGNDPALGQSLYSQDKNFFQGEDYFVVKGVYKDFPENSSVQNIIYAPIGDLFANQWDNNAFNTYLKIGSEDEVDQVKTAYKEYINNNAFGDYTKKIKFILTPLTEAHFDKDVTFDFIPKTSRETIMILSLIAFIIIAIAAVNYTNFSIALVPVRIKAINIRKVVGASDSALRRKGISESVFMCVVAYVLSIVLVFILSYTPLISLVDADPSLSTNMGLLAFTLAIALVVGLISGLYPSFYVTSFQPALVLKGSFGLSPKGRKMRSVLIGIQFIATFALIISGVFMYLQNEYIHNSSFGYDKDRIIVADLNTTIAQKREVITEQLKQLSGIEDVTYSWSLLSSKDEYNEWGRNYKGEVINFQVLPVDPSFIETMGIKINEGRGFRQSDAETAGGKYIFNEKARQEFGLELNHYLDNSEIIGFIPDIQFTTFHTATTPMAFYVQGTEKFMGDLTQFMYIRVKEGSNMLAVMQQVEEELVKIESGWTFDVRFYNDVLNNVYEKDRKLSLLITLFSIIAIIISIIGVFGLVIFENEYRRKEIGIRKVFGSSVKEVLLSLSKTYIIILITCFVIACPIVYFVIDRWLENFTVRTPIYAWVFLLSGAIVIAITIMTVNWQSWKAATANPVDSLKDE